MKNQMAYSLSARGFFPTDKAQQQVYVDAGSLPDDLQDISDEGYARWCNPPDGYCSVFDENGPRVEKLPEPDYVAAAEVFRAALQAEVQSATYTLNAKLLMGRTLTAAEKAKFNAWLDYSDAVDQVDTSTAPDIQWPQKPA